MENILRGPVTLTPKILVILDRHEPGKAKKAKLLREHMTWQRTLLSTEKELEQYLERKDK
jgi:hypothetical protein